MSWAEKKFVCLLNFFILLYQLFIWGFHHQFHDVHALCSGLAFQSTNVSCLAFSPYFEIGFLRFGYSFTSNISFATFSLLRVFFLSYVTCPIISVVSILSQLEISRNFFYGANFANKFSGLIPAKWSFVGFTRLVKWGFASFVSEILTKFITNAL